MSFTLPKLEYSFDALEPVIDSQTMEIHYSKHHQAYVDKLNAAIENEVELNALSLNDILIKAKELNENIKNPVVNNGGGHSNHSLFWKILTPGGKNKPVGELLEKIEKLCGSFDNFKTKFVEEGLSRFGSGWAWLVVTKSGALEHYSLPNQDSPIVNGDTPILGIDVWEHAYYLKYQNKRADYLNAVIEIINWDEVEKLYKESEI